MIEEHLKLIMWGKAAKAERNAKIYIDLVVNKRSIKEVAMEHLLNQSRICYIHSMVERYLKRYVYEQNHHVRAYHSHHHDKFYPLRPFTMCGQWLGKDRT